MRLAALLLVAMLVLFLAAAFVLFTPAGLQATAWIAARAVPGELATTGADGRLMDRFAFEKIRYRDGDLELEITGLTVDWQPLALAGGRLVIRDISAAGIEFTPPAAAGDAGPATVPELPLAIRVDRLGVARLRVHVTEGPIVLRELDAALRSQDSALLLDHLRVAGEIPGNEFALAAAGRLQPAPPWQHDLRIDVDWRLPGQPDVSGRLASSGDARQLAFTAETDKPLRAGLQAEVTDLLGQAGWQATLEASNADLSPWLETATPTLLSGRIEASGDDRTAEGSATVELSGELETAIDSGFRLAWSGQRHLIIHALTVDVAEPALALDLSGDLEVGDDPVVDLKGSWSVQEPAVVHGRLELAGRLEDYRVALRANAEQPFASDWQLAGRGNLRGLRIDRLHGELPRGSAEAGGHIDWGDAPSVQLEGEWRNVVLPTAERELNLPEGRFSLAGSPDDYTLQGGGRLHGTDIPAVDWQTAIRGNRDRASIDRLRLSLLAGEVNAGGRIEWDAAPSLEADIRLTGIDPGRHWPEWPGRLDGEARLRLEAIRQAWQMSLENLRVSGRLREYPLQLTGGAATDFSEHRLDELRLKTGDSVLRADGTISRNSRLRWELRSPDMAQFLPDAGGRVEASGRLAGDFEQPELVARLSATDLRTPWLDLRQLTADVDIQSADNRFRADIEAAGLQTDRLDIETLRMHSGGRFERHELRTRMEFSGRSLELAGHGRWRDGSWSLVLNEGDYRGALSGDWRLASPLRLAISVDSVQSPEHCWRQEDARLCLAAGWAKAGDWRGSLSLDRYPLPKETAPAAMEMSGRLAMELDVRGRGNRLQQTTGAIRLRDLTLRTDERTELRVARVTASLAGDGEGVALEIHGEFVEPSPGSLSGTLDTGPLDLAQPGQAAMDGRIRANIRDLRPWLKLYPRFSAEQAGLMLDFAVGGRIADPSLDGELQLSAGNVDIPELGITLKTLELRAEGRPQAPLQLTGKAASGPGTLAFDGRLAFEDGSVVMPELRLTGDRFEIVSLPEVWILVTPDLRLDYADGLLNATGDVTIPEALFQPFGAPGTIPVSEDEYIVTDETDQAGPRMKTRADLRVQLGDRVRVTGRGFESRLEGALRIRQEPEAPASASGELRLADGRYSAYGQELTVRSGTIIFTNQPIDNPAIQAEAVRTVGSVTAGIRASGTAQDPVTELFSTPAMPEADILSYLIIGRPLSGATSGDGDILLQAAASMGIKGTAGLRQNIAATLGLDTLAVDTGTGAEGEADTRLVIGKYLSPDLYLSYGAGLVDSAVDTVKLRYEINRRLSLEAEQGRGTGVDLLYQLESGGWWD